MFSITWLDIAGLSIMVGVAVIIILSRRRGKNGF